MSSYQRTQIDLLPLPTPQHEELPYLLDDFSLALHLGIRCRTLWWCIHNKKNMYRLFYIPKSDGSARCIHNPKKPLKFIQRRIYQVILKKVPLLDCVGAYVPRRGCLESAKRHTGHAIRIGMDLKDFFPSHRRARVRHFFIDCCGYTHQVSSILAELCTAPDLAAYRDAIAAATSDTENIKIKHHFVPQGSPASPSLCNLIAQESLDKTLLAAITDEGWVYTRYSDDLTFSHPENKSRREVDVFLQRVKTIINDAGYRIHAKKTKIQRYWHRQHMLGIVVNQHPNIPRETYRLYRSILCNCYNHGFEINASRYGHCDKGFIAHLRGKISYFKSVNESKGLKLEQQLKRAIVKEFGEDFDENAGTY